MQFAPAKTIFKVDNAALHQFIFFVVFVAFLPAVFNGFTTYDDPEYVTANPYVQSGLTLESFEWAFRAHGANWHPLTWLSHILDGQIYGMKPWGHHLTNVLFHAMNALLVFRLLLKLTGGGGRSFAVALLFGLHPLRVESVAWVAERKDVLSVFFWLLTLLAYARYVNESRIQSAKSKVFYVLVLLCFGLGLLSKSMVVTLPCVLLLLDFWPLARHKTIRWRRLALEKVPFFLLAAVMCGIAYHAQSRGSAMVSSLPLSPRVANALVSYCRYLGKIFWPVDLCAIYPMPPGWPPLLVAGAALLLAALTLLAVLNAKRQPWLLFGWLWFLGTMVPVIGIVQIGNQSLADRYSYIPSLGIFIALVWCVAELTKGWRIQSAALPLATTALACVCAMLTIRQISYWKNSEVMFRRCFAVTSDNTLACVGLGMCEAARKDWPDAIAHYHQAIQISPDYYEAHENLGMALMETGKLDEALDEFRRAVTSRPGVAEGHINLATALSHRGELAEAVTQLQSAVTVEPGNAMAHANLGNILSRQNDFPAAAAQFKLAVDLRPDDVQLHYDLAEALQACRKPDDAIREFRAALKIAPQNAQIHNDLGTALANQGALDDAIQEFRTAVKMDPNYSVAAANLDRALKIEAQSRAAHK